MKVYCSSDPDRRAYKRPYKDGRPPKYRAFPVAENELSYEQSFETEEELAYFLLANPNWKTVVKATGAQDGHVNRGIIIEGKIEIDRLK